MAFMIIWTRLFRNVCMVLGNVYPLYASYAVLERRKLLLNQQNGHATDINSNRSPAPTEAEAEASRVEVALLEAREEMIEWVTFWVVNACWWTFETFVENSIGNFTRLGPVYFGLKLLFLGWLVLPFSHGHQLLYAKLIAPAFVEHEKDIDSALDQLKQKATEKMASVCKETAQFALQTSSSLLLQGQQYVAAQLFQQALANFQLSPRQQQQQQQKDTDKAIVADDPPPPSSAAAAADAKSAFTKLDGTRSASVFAFDQAKAVAKDDKSSNATQEISSKGSGFNAVEEDKHQQHKAYPVPPTNQPLASSTADPKSVLPVPAPTDLQRSMSKSTELVTHFKKLLIRGFHLKYHATCHVVKRRVLRLQDANARYLLFERDNSNDPRASSSTTNKFVRLLIQSIRNVATMKLDLLVKKQLVGSDQLEAHEQGDDERWFVMETDALGLFVFEAESLKTRELLVAGLRLLVLERKRQVLRVLTALETLVNRRRQQEALVRWHHATTT